MRYLRGRYTLRRRRRYRTTRFRSSAQNKCSGKESCHNRYEEFKIIYCKPCSGKLRRMSTPPCPPSANESPTSVDAHRYIAQCFLSPGFGCTTGTDWRRRFTLTVLPFPAQYIYELQNSRRSSLHPVNLRMCAHDCGYCVVGRPLPFEPRPGQAHTLFVE